MKSILPFSTALAALLLPAFVFAEEFDIVGGTLGDFFTQVLNFINGILIPLVIGLALLVFIYGLYKFFILGGGDEGSREEGRQLMLYSILAFFLMVTIFAIVELLAGGLFGENRETEIDVPGVTIEN